MTNYNTKSADLYIQRGFLKKLPKDAEKQPLNMIFNLSRWLREELQKMGVTFREACCGNSGGFPTRLKADKSGIEYLDVDGSWKDVTTP